MGPGLAVRRDPAVLHASLHESSQATGARDRRWCKLCSWMMNTYTQPKDVTTAASDAFVGDTARAVKKRKPRKFGRRCGSFCYNCSSNHVHVYLCHKTLPQRYSSKLNKEHQVAYSS